MLPAAEYSPFFGIEKGAVLQEARIFHHPQIDPRSCQQAITKLLYLLNQGETFTKVRCSETKKRHQASASGLTDPRSQACRDAWRFLTNSSCQSGALRFCCQGSMQGTFGRRRCF